MPPNSKQVSSIPSIPNSPLKAVGTLNSDRSLRLESPLNSEEGRYQVDGTQLGSVDQPMIQEKPVDKKDDEVIVKELKDELKLAEKVEGIHQ